MIGPALILVIMAILGVILLSEGAERRYAVDWEESAKKLTEIAEDDDKPRLLTLAELNALEDEVDIPRTQPGQWAEPEPIAMPKRDISKLEMKKVEAYAAKHTKLRRPHVPEPDYVPSRQTARGPSTVTYSAVLHPDPFIEVDQDWINENVFEYHLSTGKTRYMYECSFCLEAWKADKPEDLWKYRSHGCKVPTPEQHEERSRLKELWMDAAMPLKDRNGRN